MELRRNVQEYFDNFCQDRDIFPIPQARLIQNTSQRKNCGDFNIFIRQPTFDSLKSYFEEIVTDLPKKSQSWNLPLEKVVYSPKSAYLELFLERSLAFKMIFEHVTSPSKKIRIQNEQKLLIVYAPEQPEFDLKRSDMLSEYVHVMYSNCGYRVDLILDLPDASLSEKSYQDVGYFDKAKMAFDLRKYLEDSKMIDEYDANIGYCYLDSGAIPIAASLRQLLLNEGDAPNITVCHIVPQNKAYVQQQAALVIEILGVQIKRQVFLIHGGTDPRDYTLNGYESHIDDYVRQSLKQRHLDMSDPTVIQSIHTLTASKIKFDLLTCRQTARLKIPSKEKVGSFDGKGGIFVQYTCARLAVLLRNYDRYVDEGKYNTPKVADLTQQDIDLGTLSLEQDWLLWRICYRCATVLDKSAMIPLSDELPIKADMIAHSVCELLISLCVEFSTYYSKVRILVENQPHLMESLKARVFLLKIVQRILHRGLVVLALKPVERM